jgi:hypothetical protein
MAGAEAEAEVVLLGSTQDVAVRIAIYDAGTKLSAQLARDRCPSMPG